MSGEDGFEWGNIYSDTLSDNILLILGNSEAHPLLDLVDISGFGN
jgi:hypothetical protein